MSGFVAFLVGCGLAIVLERRPIANMPWSRRRLDVDHNVGYQAAALSP